MKNQKGFTLIELLLVLDIIGIISAIAIPALLSQRSRARDKSAIQNMTGRMGDLVGQYDKLKEAASATIPADLGLYLAATGGGDKNPWNPATAAFNTTLSASTATTQALALTHIAGIAAGGTKGLVEFALAPPGTGTPGFIEGGVLCDNAQGGGATPIYTVCKATAIE